MNYELMVGGVDPRPPGDVHMNEVATTLSPEPSEHPSNCLVFDPLPVLFILMLVFFVGFFILEIPLGIFSHPLDARTPHHASKDAQYV